VRGFILDDDDRLRRDIIERLMCDLAVDLAAAARRHGRETGAFASELAALEPMVEDGFVEIADERITVTEAGRPFVRAVAATFDRYFRHGEARHSMAV
jgi:oxygen-independent coproporphyrinogen-3 oxidase